MYLSTSVYGAGAGAGTGAGAGLIFFRLFLPAESIFVSDNNFDGFGDSMIDFVMDFETEFFCLGVD